MGPLPSPFPEDTLTEAVEPAPRPDGISFASAQAQLSAGRRMFFARNRSVVPDLARKGGPDGPRRHAKGRRLVSGDPGPFYARCGPSPPDWAKSNTQGTKETLRTSKGAAAELVIHPYARSSKNTDLPRTRANGGKKRSTSSRVLRACIAAPLPVLLWRPFTPRLWSGISRISPKDGPSGSYKTRPEGLECLRVSLLREARGCHEAYLGCSWQWTEWALE